MKDQYISEIYTLIEGATSTKDKVDILRAYKDNKDFVTTIRKVFNKDPQFHFNGVTPDYRPLDGEPDFGMTSYTEALRRLYLFEIGNPNASPNIQPRQREVLLIQILESLSHDEAEVYANMLKKKTCKGLTKAIVKQAFPYLLEKETNDA